MSNEPEKPVSKSDHTAEEKLRVVSEASRLSEAELGAYLRREGLHSTQIDEWRRAILESLADAYVASESTVYRLLRRNEKLAHRGRARPATHRRPDEVIATAPNQAWCWDITWLPTPVRGQFLFLYTILDVFSRKIVGWAVHDRESDRSAAALVDAACRGEGVRRDQLVMHSDNGSPMKGAAMLATLQRLGIVPSFSRPGVSDDNPYIEALFRTLKYCPEYPSKPFASQAEAGSSASSTGTTTATATAPSAS